ncbi:MAG: DUF6062 family protein [Firmicutes bacterium]|nr:DUF6062 family protein [Bacillota bacterium]
MEKIYTIPVNEAFEKTDGCPFCSLYDKLEANEIDLILGASMMEPDVRIETNKKGFCKKHFEQMFNAKNRLGLALMLESHLAEVKKGIKLPSVSLKPKGDGAAQAAHGFNESCYICDRIEFHFEKMFETAAMLWESDRQFRAKFAAQPYFCLHHYERMLTAARRVQSKKTFAAFTEDADKIESAYIEKLCGDVSWFCKKFDYRYKDEPWNDSKDAVERAIKFLS